MRLLLPLLLLPALASAQTLPLRLPQFIDPPEANGANPITYPHGIIYNPTLLCVQGTVGASWECLARVTQVAAVAAAAAAAQAAAEEAATAAANAQSTASSAAAAANTAQTSATSAATAASNAQSTANAAQTAATNAGTAAAAAQSTANAAQTTANSAASSASANASAIAALVTRVGTAEGVISALQSTVATLNALPKRLCTTATLTGLSIPLTGGLSSTQNVSLPGVPVGSTCTVAGSSRPPAGATGSPVVTTAGVVNVAFVGGGGLLSGVLAIPSGTYRVCCDL